MEIEYTHVEATFVDLTPLCKVFHLNEMVKTIVFRPITIKLEYDHQFLLEMNRNCEWKLNCRMKKPLSNILHALQFQHVHAVTEFISGMYKTKHNVAKLLNNTIKQMSYDGYMESLYHVTVSSRNFDVDGYATKKDDKLKFFLCTSPSSIELGTMQSFRSGKHGFSYFELAPVTIALRTLPIHDILHHEHEMVPFNSIRVSKVECIPLNAVQMLLQFKRDIAHQEESVQVLLDFVKRTIEIQINDSKLCYDMIGKDLRSVLRPSHFCDIAIQFGN